MSSKKCNACGGSAASICSGCRIVYYCSGKCQTSSWPTHKVSCKKAKKEAKENLEDMWDAAHEGDAVEVLRLLREYPATVNMMYSRDFGIMVVRGYALDIAAAEGHLECVKVLMDFGANQLQPEPDFGQLAIHRAASNGHLDIVKYLLEKGAPILEPDQQGQTSLHFAAEHGRTEVCKFLLDHGARPSLAVKYRGKTPKMWAEMGGHFDCAAVL